MLNDIKLQTLQGFLETLSEEELIWINGYVSGMVSSRSAAEGQPSSRQVTLVYGTESGNSKRLATAFTTQAKRTGIQVKLSSLDQYRLTDLQKEECLLVVISTQGDGEPPVSAKKFYDYLHTDSLTLSKLNFGVLALGDTAYPLFCKAGEDVDNRLQHLGGKRLVDIQKCDTDFEEEARNWFNSALAALAPVTSFEKRPTAPVIKTAGKKKLIGTLISNVNLSGRGSAKETHHLEIATDSFYQPGDSIGVVPENPINLVNTILALVGWSSDQRLFFRGGEYSLADLLQKKVNIVYLPERVVQKYGTLVEQEIPNTRIDLLNLLKIYPLKDQTQFEEVITLLEPITPRLYSIASSPKAHPGEIHLTVARDKFLVDGEVHYGLCSDYFIQLRQDATLEFYIHKNSEFRLPEPDRDIIMIGPGTGVAPFRSFIAERDATGATGRNWLFFGDQRFAVDFLYQTEFQGHLNSGALTKVSLAFSRDQTEKIYVQHRMLEHAEAIYHWIQSGAVVYVCGAKHPMSNDVENALLGIISEHGKKTKEEAIEYLEKMKVEDRYHKDVY